MAIVSWSDGLLLTGACDALEVSVALVVLGKPPALLILYTASDHMLFARPIPCVTDHITATCIIQYPLESGISNEIAKPERISIHELNFSVTNLPSLEVAITLDRII